MSLLGYLLSVVMGVSLGLVGGGGSILTVPILFYFFHQDSLVATRNSLFIVGVTALAGTLINLKKRNIEFKTGILFAIPSFFGIYFSRHFLLPKLPENLGTYFTLTLTKPLLVMILFAVLMVLASRAMIRSGSLVKEKSALVVHHSPSIISVAWRGLFVGVITGFVGAGGGFLIIPALVLLLNLPMRRAVATSLAIIAANSMFGFFTSLSVAPIDWTQLLLICTLAVMGLALGQAFAHNVNEQQLKRGFGFFVLLIGSSVLIDQILRLF